MRVFPDVLSGNTQLTLCIFPDVCVPTWLAIAGAILAGVVLVSLLIRSVGWWRERKRQHEQGEPRERQRVSLPRWIELAALVVGTVVAVAGILHCEPPDVRISLADSRLNPAGDEQPSDEFVCLVNYEDQAVSLAGWELDAAERRINVLPDFTLASGAAVRVHPGEGSNSGNDLYGEKGSPQWRNDGGQIRLLDSEGQEVDSVGYGERQSGDGSGGCGRTAKVPALALKITSPDQGATVEAETITIRGTVTPGSVVQAKLDHDDESDAGGEVAQLVSGEGADRFTVALQLEPGENHIRVWAEKPGAEPVFNGVAVVLEEPGDQPLCDPNYEGACLDPAASDYDCAGGEGDGPEYVEGPITIVGEDRFDLDSDGDGTACEPFP